MPNVLKHSVFMLTYHAYTVLSEHNVCAAHAYKIPASQKKPQNSDENVLPKTFLFSADEISKFGRKEKCLLFLNVLICKLLFLLRREKKSLAGSILHNMLGQVPAFFVRPLLCFMKLLNGRIPFLFSRNVLRNWRNWYEKWCKSTFFAWYVVMMITTFHHVWTRKIVVTFHIMGW